MYVLPVITGTCAVGAAVEAVDSVDADFSGVAEAPLETIGAGEPSNTDAQPVADKAVSVKIAAALPIRH